MMQTANTKLFLAFAITLVAGCVGKIGDNPDNNADGDAGVDAEPDAMPDDPLTGAGGRDLTEFWPAISIPYGENTRMMTYEQVKNEVLRATGRSWIVASVDQWAPNRSVLGGADYVRTFSDDRSPNQQKIVTLRRMAFSVCGDVVTAEAGQATRTIFTVVDPATTIDIASATATAQVQALWKRFFLVDPSAADVTESLSALGSLQTMATSREAWRGLCGAYLASMRFLTY